MRKTLNEKDDLRMRRRVWTAFAVYAAAVTVMFCGATTAFAAGDPIGAVNNLSTFIFTSAPIRNPYGTIRMMNSP